MQQYEFSATIEKGMIYIPENILDKVSSQVKVIIQTGNNKNLPDEITLASEKSLSSDWLLPDEDLAWQNL